jgi:hypothetical protein
MHLLSSALAFLLAAATGLPATAPSTQPVAERRVLEFVPEATPDAKAAAAGAVPFYNDVAMSETHWVDYFTGWGCVHGPFKTAEVSLAESGGELRFRAVCAEGGLPDERTSVEWRGTIVDGKVSGEILISAPGPAVGVAEVRAALEAKRQKTTMIRGDGATIQNVPALNQAYREVNLLAARGRTLRFSFKAELGRRVIPPGTNGEVFVVTPAPVHNPPMQRTATASGGAVE